MKKGEIYLSVILVLNMILSPSFTSYAKSTPKVTVINEYAMYKEKITKSNTQLKAEGFTDEKIKQLRSFSYVDEYKNRNKLDNKTLKSLGYSDNQISILRNFDGSDQQIYALAANQSVYAYAYSYAMGVSNSHMTISFQWNWDSCPAQIYSDAVAVTWSGGFISSLNSSLTNLFINYKDTAGIYSQTMLIPNGPGWKATPGQGVGWEFPFGTYVTGNTYRKWAYNGSGIVYINSSDPISQMQANFTYGHQTLSLSPGLTIGWPSIGFNVGVVKYPYTFNLPDF